MIEELQRVVKWICTFDMGMFPFNTQKCQMIFYGNDKNLKLKVQEVKYTGTSYGFFGMFFFSNCCVFYGPYFLEISGPKDLAIYTVADLNFCENYTADENVSAFSNGVLVEILLQRPILDNILTKFLPTSLVLILRMYQNSFF